MNYWDRLKSLNILSLQRRRERYCILYMWKIAHGIVPNQLQIIFYENDRLGLKAKIPLIKTKERPDMHSTSFACVGPKLWNLLPKHLNTSTSLNILKSNLAKFINKFPDEPPTKGYISRCNNSLVAWAQRKY